MAKSELPSTQTTPTDAALDAAEDRSLLEIYKASAQTTTKLPGEQFTLTVHKGDAGQWYVTGSMHRGLLIFGHDLGEALSKVPGAWAELQRADQEAARAKSSD